MGQKTTRPRLFNFNTKSLTIYYLGQVGLVELVELDRLA